MSIFKKIKFSKKACLQTVLFWLLEVFSCNGEQLVRQPEISRDYRILFLTLLAALYGLNFVYPDCLYRSVGLCMKYQIHCNLICCSSKTGCTPGEDKSLNVLLRGPYEQYILPPVPNSLVWSMIVT